MRYFRLISPQLSRIQKTLSQKPYLSLPLSIQSKLESPVVTRGFTSSAQEQRPEPSKSVAAIVDELSGLTLLEVADLTEVLREKLDIKEMPTMAVMMPGMSFAPGAAGAKSAAKPGGAEVAAEKTAFDVKLEAFDAAAKIKVIKEVRTFTDLGLKEAKDLVEKVPTLLKKGVPKEEAEKIIAKMKEVGAKVSME
ncbi:putative 50S ribosomal protein L7/L12 [Tripterygium wilfordii]|uniref:Putative 50S ribosomal protein L7/L12 n=1 Tax=Tripterygium wilfordii TaxID=458696 RepID=A0A7J7E395_TRIWF|nr:50S ribosomal protein L7/L12 [Tripterygium wilfordii]XP_038699748.1 50S ribosomal protein L7/L12 [Tripterygium wilfordii]XP_038699755.1 50S ribosomal protein L7/L12 [Tripterygium wilfordii]KAF5753009.1 putative 50S ribosomal protein L7/L12 [Tripterygium wilfordii]